MVCQLERNLGAARALVSTRCTSEMAQASTIGFRFERALSRARARVGSRDTSSTRLRALAHRPVPRSLGGEKRGNAVRISASAGALESSPFRMIVLRHSDSCTQDADLRDHDRPLTSWGRTAAAKLCSELVAKGWAEPDLVLCSASTRSRETLGEMVRTHAPLGKAETHFMGSLYAFAAMDGLTADHLRETVAGLVELEEAPRQRGELEHEHLHLGLAPRVRGLQVVAVAVEVDRRVRDAADDDDAVAVAEVPD